MTRKSQTAPSPTSVVKTKLTIAQLQEMVEKQDLIIQKLSDDAERKTDLIQSLEEKINKLEGQISIESSLRFVRERVTDELKQQLINLQQYTRRYSAVICGIEMMTMKSMTL